MHSANHLQQLAVMLQQEASSDDESLFLRPAHQEVQSVRRGISKSESARRLAVNRSTVGRYLKQFDKEGSLLSKKASASRSSKKCLRVLLTDLYHAVALG
jgi:DNA invertase Pin-like site-specific DNA recombinase